MDARLSGGRPVDALAFGRFEWRPTQRLLLVDRTAAPLGARALDLLDALIQRRARVVTKDELLDAVWPGLVVEDANLHVQVSALRKVLGSGVIATIPGRGYRFVAPLDGDAADPVLSGRIHTSLGLGILIRNENLLVKTFEVSFSFYPYVPEEDGAVFDVGRYSNFTPRLNDFTFTQPNVVGY